MANDSSMVQRSIFNEQEKELRLINNLLGEITRILLQKEDHAPEIERLRELPQDHPAIRIGQETLLRNDETDLQLHVALKMVREQVLQVWEEKSFLIDNY